MTDAAPPPAKIARPRQLRLLEVGNPLAARLGPSFFKSLPRQPGVYFFYDHNGRLLYIGQSCDLRARVGSYRHVTPERHPRRTLRLVHRIARAEITICESPVAAIELEARLLLEHRPPFNRAGVWQPPPWWLSLNEHPTCLSVSLSRAPDSAAPGVTGPLPSSFRHSLAALARCLLRLHHPALPLAAFPIGWLSPTLPLSFQLPLTSQDLPRQIAGFATGTCIALRNLIQQTLDPLQCAAETEKSFWLDQLDVIHRYNPAKSPNPVIQPPPKLTEAAFLL